MPFPTVFSEGVTRLSTQNGHKVKSCSNTNSSGRGSPSESVVGKTPETSSVGARFIKPRDLTVRRMMVDVKMVVEGDAA